MRSIHFFALACLLFPSCNENDTASREADGKPVVFVPIAPYAGLVERIAGDTVHVVTLVAEADDPHSFSPTPKAVASLVSADIYFSVDLPFEKRLVETLEKTEGRLDVVNLVKNLDRRTFAEGEHDHAHGHDHDEEHDHDDEHDHDHDDHDEELDPHVWLSPSLLIEQINRIEKALADVVETPEDRELLAENALGLIFDITSLDKELVGTLAPLRGKTFYVYHGAFGYFAEAYGLVQETVELGGRGPGPKKLASLVEQAKRDGVTVIFVQPQFDTTSAENLAEAIGGRVVPIDPLAKDIIGNLRDIAAKLSSE